LSKIKEPERLRVPVACHMRAADIAERGSLACIKVAHGRLRRARLLYVTAIKDLPPTFVTERALAEGVSPRDLYAARDRGQILELSRGVFRRADAPPASFPDLLAVAYRSPVAIVCLISAAAVHDLTDEIPAAVQIAVPRSSHPPRVTLPPTAVFRFEPSTFELGLTHVEAAPGESVRIYDPARTVVDLMRLRHRVGEPTALAALHRYLRRRDARPAELLDIAATLRVYGPVLLAVDVASAG
jgi:predicted transcriptional regulator of viral defense system